MTTDELADTKKRVLWDVWVETGIEMFVETGTARGVTVEAALEVGFQRVVSIEIVHGFYEMAAQKFLWDDRVRILHGDSAVMLPHVLHVLNEPAVFLLDAHYTGGAQDVRGRDGDTPVSAELGAILAHPGRLPHIVLIDDARLFGTDPAYPPLDRIEVITAGHGYEMTVADDIIRLRRAD